MTKAITIILSQRIRRRFCCIHSKWERKEIEIYNRILELGKVIIIKIVIEITKTIQKSAKDEDRYISKSDSYVEKEYLENQEKHSFYGNLWIKKKSKSI